MDAITGLYRAGHSLRPLLENYLNSRGFGSIPFSRDRLDHETVYWPLLALIIYHLHRGKSTVTDVSTVAHNKCPVSGSISPSENLVFRTTSPSSLSYAYPYQSISGRDRDT